MPTVTTVTGILAGASRHDCEPDSREHGPWCPEPEQLDAKRNERAYGDSPIDPRKGRARPADLDLRQAVAAQPGCGCTADGTVGTGGQLGAANRRNAPQRGTN